MANAAKQFGPRKLDAPGWSGSQQLHGGFGSGGSRSRGLPPPTELAGRVEEARTSAKLLLQLVQSTPANELLGNELVKEFAERCTSAQRSIHGYIACDNPAPDDDTMLTLIETNEQLSLAASKHQRAVLQARRLMGASPSPPAQNGNNFAPPQSFVPPPQPPHSYESASLPPHQSAPSLPPLSVATTEPSQPLTSNPTAYKNNDLPLPPALQAGSGRQRTSTQEEDPFADQYDTTYTPPGGPPPQDPRSNGYGGSPDSYHPGYQSTPSYLGRQESSVNNLTMHGAQTSIPEGDEHARPNHDDPRSRSPDLNVPQQQSAHDVSPIAERNTVTYRY